MTSPDGRAAMVEQRRTLARLRDRALQQVHIAEGDVEAGRRDQEDLDDAFDNALIACNAVTTFDAEHPGIRTESNAEDDAQVWRFMNKS
jgi:hypothetical protein